MNRDETIALFEQCEMARKTALDAGKDEGEAHAAAKTIWNGWAEPLLTERKVTRVDRWWRLFKANLGLTLRQIFDEDNKPDDKAYAEAYAEAEEAHVMQEWLSARTVDFSGLRFEIEAFASGDNTDANAPNIPVKSIVVHGKKINFEGYIFPGYVEFNDAKFSGDVDFSNTQFLGHAEFQNVQFLSSATFRSAEFSDHTIFSSAHFRGTAWFEWVKFYRDVGFAFTKFDRYASFQESHFQETAQFYAIEVESGFDLESTQFNKVPDFIQAHFKEPPRLDNVRVSNQLSIAKSLILILQNSPGLLLPPLLFGAAIFVAFMNAPLESALESAESSFIIVLCISLIYLVFLHFYWGNADAPARFRALKRVAIQGHDTDREHMFFVKELRTARFTEDWPLPFQFWRADAWNGFGRFWFGLAYEIFGGLGSSTLRPALWWFISILVAAMFYLGENPEMAKKRTGLQAQGASTVSAYLRTSIAALRERQGCYLPEGSVDDEKTAEQGQEQLKSLPLKIRELTSAPGEALQLALRTSFVFPDSGSDTRSYGCLYGVLRSGSSIAFIPPAVSVVASVQKIVSAVLLFLFGLALRNMLKMK